MKKKTRTLGARKARTWYLTRSIGTGEPIEMWPKRKYAVERTLQKVPNKKYFSVIKVREVLPRRKAK